MRRTAVWLNLYGSQFIQLKANRQKSQKMHFCKGNLWKLPNFMNSNFESFYKSTLHTFIVTQFITESTRLPFKISIDRCCTPKRLFASTPFAGVISSTTILEWKFARISYIKLTRLFAITLNFILFITEAFAVVI